MELSTGTRIANRYVVERLLAKGGMGAVYVARDVQMGARVALKVTGAAGGARDELERRFVREARIGHRLAKGRLGFVRASEWGKLDAFQLYLVMELIDGARPLDLRTGSREERLARWRKAAELVRIAHENGVLHRDLKPANFLQAPDGAIHLTDFGLAKVLPRPADDEVDEGDEAPVSLTVTGVGFGTPPYMAPEQLEDAKHADERADVYALGCMLHEALAGVLPYPGPTPTAVNKAHIQVQAGVKAPPRPRAADPSVDLLQDEACGWALELELSRRCPSVAALLAALDGQAPTRFEGGAPPDSLGARSPGGRGALELQAGLGLESTAPTGKPSSKPGPLGRAAAPDAAGRAEQADPLLSNLPTGDGVPTDRPEVSAPSMALPAAADASPGRAAAVAVVLLLAMGVAVAANVGGLRDRLTRSAQGAPMTTGAEPEASEGSPVDAEPGSVTESPPATELSSPSATEPSSPPAAEPAPPPATERPVPQGLELVGLVPEDGTVVPDLRVDIEGRVGGAPRGTAVRVQGMTCRLDADGAFRLPRLSLDAGPNTIEVEVDAPGVEPLRRRLTVVADPDDPILTLEGPADGFETVEGQVVVRARIEDATAVEVTLAGYDGATETLGVVPPGGGPLGPLSVSVPLPSIGSNVLLITARDAAGRTASARRTVVRRVARLTLALESPLDDSSTGAAAPRLRGRVTGDAAPGTLDLTLWVDGIEVALSARPDGAFDQPLSLVEGPRTLEVLASARGPSGEPLEARERRRLRVDRTAPTLRFLAPTEGAEFGADSVDVRAEVTDAAPWVDVSMNGDMATRIEQGQSFVGRAAGDVTELLLVAVDPAGNRSEARRSISRRPPDTKAPVIIVQGPRAGSTLATNPIDVVVLVIDDVGVTRVTIAGVEALPTSDGTWRGQVTGHRGLNQVRIDASDAAGNLGRSEVSFVYQPPPPRDTQAPVIVVRSPTAALLGWPVGVTLVRNPVDVVVAVTDDVGVARVTIAGAEAQATGDGTWRGQVHGLEGENCVRIEAFDAAGNVGRAEVKFNFASAPLDTQAPVITVQAPRGGVTLDTSSVDVVVSVMDVVGVTRVTIGGAEAQAKGNSTWRGQVRAQAGGNRVRIEAFDAAGNVGRAEVFFNFESAPARGLGARVDDRQEQEGASPWPGGPASLPAGVVRGPKAGEYRNAKDGSILVYVAPGRFRMGSDSGESDEKPVHEVQLTRGYFVGKTEVTWGQFRAFCRARGVRPPTNVIDYQGRFEALDSHPVFNVSWDDAQSYCEWAGVRLPSEAEWEFAARGVFGRTFPWGNQKPDTTQANLTGGEDGHPTTGPVGSFPGGASAFGALDMAGNVWEWVQDWYAESYPSEAQSDPSGPATGAYRVFRGGSWRYASALSRAQVRRRYAPGVRLDDLGFRVARSEGDLADRSR